MKQLLFASVLALGVSAAFADSDCCPKGNSAACPTTCSSTCTEKCPTTACKPELACDDECGSTCNRDEVTELYNALAKKSKKVDTDCEEQTCEIKDVLKEVKHIVDDCNARLKAALAKYPTLAQELNLKGTLNVNLYVDEESAQ